MTNLSKNEVLTRDANPFDPDGGRPRVALIAGPTASGKTALALALARQEPATVINADSAQVYADLSVLSARPSAEEMGDIPHRLFGTIDGAHACSAAAWAEAAKEEIRAAHEAGRLAILVGGTGLYLRTLMEGIAPIPEIDSDVRSAVRSLPVSDAYAALERLDPLSAERLRPTDTTRVARALEVVRSTGTPLPLWQQRKEGGVADHIRLATAILLPPRPWLYERIDRRFAAMVEGGAREEVERLLARKLDPALPVMRAIGVAEITAWIKGEMRKEEAIAAGAQASRRYAKRQYTWFAHQPPPQWSVFDAQLDDRQISHIATKLRATWLTE